MIQKVIEKDKILENTTKIKNYKWKGSESD